MTPRDRLSLVMDERDNQGDDQSPPTDDLAMQLSASVTDALSLRVRRVEKRLDALMECPEVVAMMARLDTRRNYA